MPRCPFCGYSRPETADIEVPTTCPAPRTLPDGVDSSPSQSSLVGHLLVGTTLRELETLLITATLQRTSGNVKAAAAILGIEEA